MKIIRVLITFFASLLLNLHAYAQPGEWTWMHGSNLPNAGGIFGLQGVPSPTTVPPAMYEACEFKDLSGNFWLYGGVGLGTQNNLWKYDPAANEWTWMTGSNIPNSAGVFGTQGVSSPSNQPPALGYGSATWTDLNGNFWMFGGYGGGDMNCLWKYDLGTNEWTWMTGSNISAAPGVYGTQGVPSTLNTPGARLETAAAWTDNSGDLWLFGGTTAAGNINDLWRYHIATSEWTWMKGSQLVLQAGVYGTMGVEDPANTPGSRQVYSRWKDISGNLWLFGGGDYPTNNYFNDMWRYNPFTNNWTWMNGSSMQNAPGNYGTRCIPSGTNLPPPRFESRGAGTDANGNFWMFGGGEGGGTIPQVWNDLWMYCAATNQWTWMNNDTTNNPAGNWGAIGITAPTNKPNGRSGNLLWSDNSGHLYSFGGSTANYNTPFQDLWKFNIDPSCALCNTLPMALFNAPHHICPGTCTDFTNLSVNASSYQWIFPGASPGTSTDVNPSTICYNTTGTYSVTLIATNANGNDTLTLTNYITVYPAPPPQGISQAGDTLFANPGAVSYQWYFDGTFIPGATDSFYVATQSGDYNVVATDGNHCEVEAAVFDVIAAVSPLSFGEGSEMSLFPNPVSSKLEIRIPGATGKEIGTSVTIYNVLGEVVLTGSLRTVNTELRTIDVSDFPAGVYYLRLSSNEKTWGAEFIKQ